MGVLLAKRNLVSYIVPSMASCEDGECALLLIQNLRRSLAMSTSMPRDCALLQKYVSQACQKFQRIHSIENRERPRWS